MNRPTILPFAALDAADSKHLHEDTQLISNIKMMMRLYAHSNELYTRSRGRPSLPARC